MCVHLNLSQCMNESKQLTRNSVPPKRGINTNKVKVLNKHLSLLLMHFVPDVLLLLARIVPRYRHAARQSGIVLRRARDLAGKLLESLALGLGDQKSGEAAQKHEEGVDLHDVVEPGRLVGRSGAAGAEGTDEDLGDDGADLAGGGGDTVGGGAVAGWETWIELLVLLHCIRVFLV